MNQTFVKQGDKLPIGIDSFRCLVTENCIFVDKTLLIHEFIKSPDKVSLILRLRRFGKSMNLNMLKYFFELVPVQTPDTINRRDLFNGLLIEKVHPELFDSHFAKYPCIYLSLKELKATSWNEMLNDVRNMISKLFRLHGYLLGAVDEFNNPFLTIEEKGEFQSILNRETDYTKSSLKFLSELLTKYHGSPCIVLIDEYDAPMECAYTNNSEDPNHEGFEFLKKAKLFFGVLFSSLLKTNDPNVYKALLVGVLRVAKSGFLSGLNNLNVYPMFESIFSTRFGFLEQEVHALFAHHPIPHSFDDVKSWYNSYLAAENISLYNPWSIINICFKKTPKPYWVDTGSAATIKELLWRADIDFQKQVDLLLQRQAIQADIQQDVQYELLKTNPAKSIWSLLYYAGYLTGTIDGSSFSVSIPNREVLSEWKGWFSDILYSSSNVSVSSLLQLLLTGDGEKFSEAFPHALKSSLSYFDVGGSKSGKKAESFYHAFCLGLFIHARDRSCEVKSESPAGMGRFDFSLYPAPNSDLHAVIIEFKIVYDGESLAEKSQAGLQQIQDKVYRAAIPPFVNKLLELGVAFKVVEVESIACEHYAAYRKYLLQNPLSSSKSARRLQQMDKLSRLSDQDLTVMSINVFDDLQRRIQLVLPFLAPLPHLSPQKNDERKSLAGINEKGFNNLCTDISSQLEVRFPSAVRRFNASNNPGNDSLNVDEMLGVKRSPSLERGRQLPSLQTGANLLSPNSNSGPTLASPRNPNFRQRSQERLVDTNSPSVGQYDNGRRAASRSRAKTMDIKNTSRVYNSPLMDLQSSNENIGYQSANNYISRDTLEKQRNDYEGIIMELKSKISILESSGGRERVKDLEDKILAKVRETQEISIDLDELKQENDLLSQDLNDQQLIEIDLRDEINNFVNEVNDQTKVIEGFSKEKAEIVLKYDDIIKKNSDLEKSNLDLKQSTAKLIEEVNNLKDLNSELNRKTAMLEQSLRNTPRSLPETPSEDTRSKTPMEQTRSKTPTENNNNYQTVKNIPQDLLESFKRDINIFKNAIQNETGKQILFPMKSIVLSCRSILQIVDNIANSPGGGLGDDLKFVQEKLASSLASVVEKTKLFASGDSSVDKGRMKVACSELASNVENLASVLEIDAQMEFLNMDFAENSTEITPIPPTKSLLMEEASKKPIIMISDDKIDLFKHVLNTFLDKVRNESNKNAVIAVKNVIIVCRDITQEIEKIQGTKNETFNQMKAKFSICLGQLVMITKNHATSSAGESLVFEIEDSSMELTESLFDLVAFCNNISAGDEDFSLKRDSIIRKQIWDEEENNVSTTPAPASAAPVPLGGKSYIDNTLIQSYEISMAKMKQNIYNNNSQNLLLSIKEVILSCRVISERVQLFEITYTIAENNKEEFLSIKDKFSEVLSMIALNAKYQTSNSESQDQLLGMGDELTNSLTNLADFINLLAAEDDSEKASALNQEGELSPENQIVSDDLMNAYHASLDNLFESARREEKKQVLMSMKEIIMACRLITQEVENANLVPTQELITRKERFSQSLANLAGILKSELTGNDEDSLTLISGAVERLTDAIYSLTGKKRKSVGGQVGVIATGVFKYQEYINEYRASIVMLLQSARSKENLSIPVKRLTQATNAIIGQSDSADDSIEMKKEECELCISNLKNAVKAHQLLSTPISDLESHATMLTQSIFDLVDTLSTQIDDFPPPTTKNNIGTADKQGEEPLVSLQNLGLHLKTHIDLIVQAIQTFLVAVRDTTTEGGDSRLTEAVFRITTIVEDIEVVSRQTLGLLEDEEVKKKGENVLDELGRVSLELVGLGQQASSKSSKQKMATLSHDIAKLVKSLLQLVTK